jgi:hypothetical protein
MEFTLLSQDRSLGSVELHVNELAKESEDDVKYPFESLGKKEATDPLHLEGNQYKGNLHYVAEFVPALALRGVEFESGPNRLQQTAESGGSDAETVDDGSTASEDLMIPEGITTSRPLGDDEEAEKPPEPNQHKKGAKSTDTTTTVDTNGTLNGSPMAETKVEKEEIGVAMTKEELLTQRMDCLIPRAASETDYSICLQNRG